MAEYLYMLLLIYGAYVAYICYETADFMHQAGWY